MSEEQWNRVETDLWNPEEKPELTGIYLGVQRDVGVNKSNMYKVESDGKFISVWGSKILDDLMVGIKSGQQIKIVFKGIVKVEKGNDYKSFELFSKPVFE